MEVSWELGHVCSARLPASEQKPGWVPEESGEGSRKINRLLGKHNQQDGRNSGAYQELFNGEENEPCKS